MGKGCLCSKVIRLTVLIEDDFAIVVAKHVFAMLNFSAASKKKGDKTEYKWEEVSPIEQEIE